ncbi:hypothetical protein MRX96_051159 [Rhipicephalus microplus]
MERALLADMTKLSLSAQTSSLELFHSLLTKIAPKSVAFSTEMTSARMQLANFHNSENADRVQDITKSGEQTWKIKLLRSKKGEQDSCNISFHVLPQGMVLDTLLPSQECQISSVLFNLPTVKSSSPQSANPTRPSDISTRIYY